MIDVSIGDDGIAVITWAVADRPMNVLNAESVKAFGEAVARVQGESSVRGVIVTSAKDEFIAGADLVALLSLTDPGEAMAAAQSLHRITRLMETGGKPFVAALNGTALGGGFEIALACHRRIAADRGDARFGQPEVTLGLIPGGGATQRLPRMIGARDALPLLLEGKRLSVDAAKEAGLIDAVVDHGDLIDAARAWLVDEAAGAEQPWDRRDYRIPGGAVWSPKGIETFLAGNAMLHRQTWGNYPAAQAIMSCVFEGLQTPIDVGLRIESRWFAKIATGDTAKAMIRTNFFHMGNARKLMTRPADQPRTEFRTVGILGAGMMGAGIAYVTALAGLDVVLLDVSEDKAKTGKAYSADLLERRVARGRLNADQKTAILDRIHTTTDFDRLAPCELVIEAVFEDREIKADVTRKAEAVIAETAFFASNTSTLPISGLAEASIRPERFIGLHFFSPVDKMPLVEIITGAETGSACLAAAMDFVQRIGKTPIVVNDRRGFYTSRVFGTFVQEGLAMLAEGVKPALIENAARLAGMAVGPLAVADEVSLDLIHKVAKQTRADLGDAYTPGPGDPVIEEMVSRQGRSGRKAGKGFYDYPKDAPKRLWPGLGDLFPVSANQPDVESVKRRLLYIQSVEAARCLDEEVVTAPEDADVGAILGWGFAPQTGGVMSLIDQVGPADFVAACDSLAQRHGARFAPPEGLRAMAEAGRRFYDKVA